MTRSITSVTYINVAQDVVDKVREEFVSKNGPGVNVLQQLQSRWELKMINAGVVLRSHAHPVAVPEPDVGVALPVHDLNIPNEGTEYKTPTAEMLFPPTPMQTPIQTPMPGTADSSVYNMPTGLSDYPTPYSNEVNVSPIVDIKPEVGRPSPYMIYNYQGVVKEDYNVLNIPAPGIDMKAGTPSSPAQNYDDEEPPLNENDDDLDEFDEGEEFNPMHLVLAQFDTVKRAKNRWKCTLKDGIMHINNKDILFNRASGEFYF